MNTRPAAPDRGALNLADFLVSADHTRYKPGHHLL
jgi:hypothetical protein